MEQVLAQLYPDEPDYERSAQLGPEALPHLMQLVEEGDPELASKATYLASLINVQGSAEVVEKAARSTDPLLRVAAAASLSNLEEMPTPLVESMLNDRDVGVRKLTLRSLETQKTIGLKPKVEEIAEGDPNISLRQLASRIANELS